MALASDLIECTVGTEKRIVGWVWTFPAFPVIPLSEIPTHVNTCLLLPAQGSHELEELIRPRGHFTSLFSLVSVGPAHPGSLSESNPSSIWQ